MQYDLVVLTDDRYLAPTELNWYNLQVLLEDEMVVDGVRQQGLTVTRKSWSEPDFDWGSTRAALFRTTWDYFDRFAEFSDWFSNVTTRTQLINPAETLRWNLNKKYLLELAKKGVSSVPSILLEQGRSHTLQSLMEQQNWTQAIVKPLVSGTARHTYRLNQTSPKQLEQVQQQFDQLILDEGFLLQEFQPNICSQGEISLIMIGGQFTHAVKKTAKTGDFRVQDDHGGSVSPYQPTHQEIQFAEETLEKCEPLPIYARVDMVNDTDNQPRLMELELIEPELFFRFNRSAALLLGKAIKDFLS